MAAPSPPGRILSVSGRSIAMAGLPVPLEDPVDLAGREVAVEVLVDHQSRSRIAGSEARVRKQREAAVLRGLAEADAELLADGPADSLVAHDPATDAVADEDHVPPHRLAVDEVVEGGDAVYLVRGHLQELSDVADRFVGDPAPVTLHGPQGLDAGAAPSGHDGQLVLDLLDLSVAQHGCGLIGRHRRGGRAS